MDVSLNLLKQSGIISMVRILLQMHERADLKKTGIKACLLKHMIT